MVVPERHPLRHGPELERVEHVADEGRPARDDLVPGIEGGDAEVPDDRVGARRGDDLLRPDVVPARRARS